MSHASDGVPLPISALAMPMSLLAWLTSLMAAARCAVLLTPGLLPAPFAAIALSTVATDAYREQNSTTGSAAISKQKTNPGNVGHDRLKTGL